MFEKNKVKFCVKNMENKWYVNNGLIRNVCSVFRK